MLQDEFRFKTRRIGTLLQCDLGMSYIEGRVLLSARNGIYDSGSQDVDMAVTTIKCLFSIPGTVSFSDLVVLEPRREICFH